MKKASGTHRSMGKKGGAKAGLESGIAHVETFKAGSAPTTGEKTQRVTKADGGGSIAT